MSLQIATGFFIFCVDGKFTGMAALRAVSGMVGNAGGFSIRAFSQPKYKIGTHVKYKKNRDNSGHLDYAVRCSAILRLSCSFIPIQS